MLTQIHTARSALIVHLVIIVNSVSFRQAFLVSDGLQRVNTQYGEFIGHISTVNFDGHVSQVVKFLGIPYAEPPIGQLRFQKTQPIKSIQTPYSANKFGHSCFQPAIFGVKDTSEDCLYLNVYVPSNAGDLGIVPKAVMVFIHGGGFIGGSGSLDMDVLSTFTDTIGVTINYRLGVLGFLSTHDKYAAGNYGLWDQHVAIQWVKDNIASFGGDPRNITIFGESAGSSSVIYQMLYAGNKGVFSRAIAESGTLSAWGSTAAQLQYNRSLSFAATLNCTGLSHEQIIACLRRVSSTDMEKAMNAYEAAVDYFRAEIIPIWVPVYDGEFVVADPRSIVDEFTKPDTASNYTSFNDIDLIIGFNNYDGAVYDFFLQYVANVTDRNRLTTLTDKDIRDRIIPGFLQLAGFPQTPLFRDAVMNEYTDWKHAGDRQRTVEKIYQMITDSALRAPSIAVADRHSANNPNTYVYQFSAISPTPYVALPSYIHGANHADELFYVFGFPRTELPENVVIPDEHKRLSKVMMTMWSNFAKSG